MVTMTYIKLLLALTIIFGDARVLSNSDRAVVFAVQQEIQSNHFEKRNDVCVGFDPTLKSVEKRILSELRRRGMRVRSIGWCNSSPRGLVVDNISPIREDGSDTYEVEIELGDFRDRSQDIGITLKHGTYVIRCVSNSEPELITYRKVCCPATNDR
jgi:hypothetical protein